MSKDFHLYGLCSVFIILEIKMKNTYQYLLAHFKITIMNLLHINKNNILIKISFQTK